MTTQADEDLENRINSATLHCATAKTQKDRRYWWNELKRLIEMRSPEQIEALERERGIYTEPKP